MAGLRFVKVMFGATNCSCPVPILVKVTDLKPIPPLLIVPKFTGDGRSCPTGFPVGATPLPCNEVIKAMEPTATWNWPEAPPTSVGVNRNVKPQDAPPAGTTLFGQLLLSMLNWGLVVPMPDIATGTVPGLVIETNRVDDPWLTNTSPKFSEAGEIVGFG